MLVDIKYAIGDPVNFQFHRVKTDSCECPFCEGCGEIQGYDGSWDDCPQCEGTGVVARRSLVNTIIDDEVIKEILVDWNREGEPKVKYKMVGWKWGLTEIPQEAILGLRTPKGGSCQSDR